MRDFCDFSHAFTCTENAGKFVFKKMSVLRNSLKSLHKEKESAFLIGEKYDLHIYCHGIENLLYFFDISSC